MYFELRAIYFEIYGSEFKIYALYFLPFYFTVFQYNRKVLFFALICRFFPHKYKAIPHIYSGKSDISFKLYGTQEFYHGIAIAFLKIIEFESSIICITLLAVSMPHDCFNFILGTTIVQTLFGSGICHG